MIKQPKSSTKCVNFCTKNGRSKLRRVREMSDFIELNQIKFIVQQIQFQQSTMKVKKINKPQRELKKGKKPPKKEKKKKLSSDEEIDEDFASQNVDQMPHDNVVQSYKSPEDVKLEIAKKLIKKAQINVKKQKQKMNDEFFMVEDEQEKLQEQEGVAEELKNEYLKGRNKLFIDQTKFYNQRMISEPISYKGHTLCITGINVTDENIFSCSKDKSIIKWDRQTQKKDFITLGKNKFDHEGPIICIDYHQYYKMIATSGEDGAVKLWDSRSHELIDTFSGHRGCVNGIKFGFNSANLCSVSSDKTLKEWDCSQRGLIQTYYGHNYEGLDLDCFSESDFISCGMDQQTIIWKTQKQTQIIFEGHDYPIDRVRAINDDKFITACQDGSLFLWSQKKKKPLHRMKNAHESWIVALDSLNQTNIMASGGCDQKIKLWSIVGEMKGLSLLRTIQTKGIVTDIKLTSSELVATSCDEHRLGRWLKTKCRNQIQVYKFIDD